MEVARTGARPAGVGISPRLCGVVMATGSVAGNPEVPAGEDGGAGAVAAAGGG